MKGNRPFTFLAPFSLLGHFTYCVICDMIKYLVPVILLEAVVQFLTVLRWVLGFSSVTVRIDDGASCIPRNTQEDGTLPDFPKSSTTVWTTLFLSEPNVKASGNPEYQRNDSFHVPSLQRDEHVKAIRLNRGHISLRYDILQDDDRRSLGVNQWHQKNNSSAMGYSVYEQQRGQHCKLLPL